TFDASSHLAQVTYTNAQRAGKRQLRYQGDAFDPVGAIFAFRHLPLREGLALCTDVYGIRRMWRLTGTIEGKENVSLPMGSFKAWHFSGTAQRIDNPSQRREIHVWISDDARRLPLAAVGAVDLGTVRATLTAFRRPGERPVRAEGKESLKW
ncbi:MAG TPA: DUF3108 domain-containing protein, partial [Myxococcaceae bacterium]|nr:DUF3108 domain-containing protein [Myxococcaceae bacterium]